MKINQYDRLANLNPSKGTEPGKIRPVVVVQTNLLNEFHPSTIICPISSNHIANAEPLRVALKKIQLDKPSDILVDQLRSIDNKRLIEPIGKLTEAQIEALRYNLNIVLDLSY